MTYVVATTSPIGGDTIFLVDRTAAPERVGFWSVELDKAYMIRNRRLAEAIVGRLKHNNPRILTIKQACEIEHKRLERAEDDFYGHG